MKSVELILKYQKRIISLLKQKDFGPLELENSVMRLNETCGFESYTHALQDLIANNRITYKQGVIKKVL